MTYSVINASGEIEQSLAGVTYKGLDLAVAKERAALNLGSYSPFCRLLNDETGTVGLIVRSRGRVTIDWQD